MAGLNTVERGPVSETPQCIIRKGARIRVPNVGEGSLSNPEGVRAHRIKPPIRAFQREAAWWKSEEPIELYDGSDLEPLPLGTNFTAYVKDSRKVKTTPPIRTEPSQPGEEYWWTRD